jgi:hypothetical protein
MGQIMDDFIADQQLASFVEDASPFEIYRTILYLDRELKSLKKMRLIAFQVHVGDKVLYFDSKTNTLISAIILEKRSKNVLLYHSDVDSSESKIIPYYMLKIGDKDFRWTVFDKKINRHTLSIGDSVGFRHTKTGQNFYGIVQRLNPQTALLMTHDGQRWKVSYSLLYPILEGSEKSIDLAINMIYP